MTFRTRLFLVSSLTVAGAVALVTGAVSVFTRNSFEEIDRSRRDALINQFQRELQAQRRRQALDAMYERLLKKYEVEIQ